MVDFEILEEIPFYGHNDESLENRYTCAALGLFYVKGSGDIAPIAIQFHQVPSETNPIWTPNDSELDWICAKMWLRNADTQYHQVSARYLIRVGFPGFHWKSQKLGIVWRKNSNMCLSIVCIWFVAISPLFWRFYHIQTGLRIEWNL